MTRELLSGAMGLWGVSLLHKASILVFSFWVGHTLGAEGVGVMASTLAIVWVISTVAGWGLPDRAPFMGASGDNGPQARRLYGIFALMVILVHGVLLLVAERVSGVTDPDCLALARGLIGGAAGQCLSAVGFSWLRGSGQPRSEIVATVVASVVLLVGPLLGAPLGWVWTAGGITLAVGAVAGSGFFPSFPGPLDGIEYLKKGTTFLIFGLGAWVLGNIDILLGRLLYAPEFVGELQVGTMAVRGMAMAPWLVATFMLRPTRQDWMDGVRPKPWLWGFSGAFIGVIISGVAWIALPFLARGHAMPVAAIDPINGVSMAIAPTFYAMVILLPLSAQWNMKRTLRAIAMGLIVQVGVGWSAAESIDVATLVIVAGLGQVVTLMWLIRTLQSHAQQSFEVDARATFPREIE